jgi:cyanophycinase-like exopeptidase
MPGRLVIMGSGETAPTMVKPHRAIFERVGAAPAVLLDTPYGFQSNADDITSKAIAYFAASVGRKVEAVSWRSVPPPGLAREKALAAIRGAGWLFAGPGSPTYALRQWRDTPIAAELVALVRRGGTLVFASAAALTLGSHSIPVYEIYKAGFDPAWAAGLDLVHQLTGLAVVVIPHYDNAEGGHHDTRFCYLGEDRLRRMESELATDSFVIGVDEHTGLILDIDARRATVVGNGRLTVRSHGQSATYPSGSELVFDDIVAAAAELASGHRPARVPATPTTETAAPAEHAVDSLLAAATEIAAQFDKAFADRNVDGCVAAVLELEQVVVDWSADTLASAEGDQARGLLRTMVVRLGELAAVGVDPRKRLSPLVTALLDARDEARRAKDFARADSIRDRLLEAGLEIRDTAAGVEWDVRD